MSKVLKLAFVLFTLLGLTAIGLILFYSDRIALLSPSGSIGVRQKELMVLSTYLMLIVVIPVLLLAFFVTWRYNASHKKPDHRPDWNHSTVAEIFWWGVPFVIVLALGYLTWQGAHELDPFKPLVSDVRPVKVQVVSLEWKWLFIYPEEGIATVNYLQIPEKTPIDFEITSDAPMNSFWIPQLGGQIYAMSGMRAQLHLLANRVGEYRGLSSHISGEGFAGMTFKTVSSTKADYLAWVDDVRGSETVLDQATYAELLRPSQYVPPAYYRLGDSDLFEEIMKKYMPIKGAGDGGK